MKSKVAQRTETLQPHVRHIQPERGKKCDGIELPPGGMLGTGRVGVARWRRDTPVNDRFACGSQTSAKNFLTKKSTRLNE